MTVLSVSLNPALEREAMGHWSSWDTTKQETDTGLEASNQNNSRAVGEWEVGFPLQLITASAIQDVVKLHAECRGRHHGFLFKDWSDYKSSAPLGTITNLDQSLGTGDGVTAAFQIYKRYTAGGSNTYVRKITRPVSGTLLVAVAGTLKTETTHYTVSYTTGLVTFTGGNIPSAAQAITCGFEFRIPVRFDIDRLPFRLVDGRVVGIPKFPIKEILE